MVIHLTVKARKVPKNVTFSQHLACSCLFAELRCSRKWTLQDIVLLQNCAKTTKFDNLE